MAREQLYDAERSLTETGIAVAKHAARLGIRKRNPKNRMTDEIADFLHVKRYINTLRTRQGAVKKRHRTCLETRIDRNAGIGTVKLLYKNKKLRIGKPDSTAMLSGQAFNIF